MKGMTGKVVLGGSLVCRGWRTRKMMAAVSRREGDNVVDSGCRNKNGEIGFVIVYSLAPVVLLTM
jgi:hypothetical protein